jgi:hypothetical protein
MQADSTFGYDQIVTELMRGIIETISDKPGITPERRASIMQTAVCSIMAFNPRDPVETMLAGHCVVYDSMLRDAVRELSQGQGGQATIKARTGVLACGKAFLAAVGMLLRMQCRPAAELAFAGTLPAQDANSVPESASDVPPDVAPPEAETPTKADVPRDPSPAAVPAQTHENVVTPMTRRHTAPAGPAPDRIPAERRPQPNPSTIILPDLGVPGIISAETADAILFDGIDAGLRQEILEAAARAVQGAER